MGQKIDIHDVEVSQKHQHRFCICNAYKINFECQSFFFQGGIKKYYFVSRFPDFDSILIPTCFIFLMKQVLSRRKQSLDLLCWFLYDRDLPHERRCLKRVQIRSFFWSVFSRIQSKYGQIRTRKKLRFWTHFCAVRVNVNQMTIFFFHSDHFSHWLPTCLQYFFYNFQKKLLNRQKRQQKI